MKRIIKVYTGSEFVFNWDEYCEFTCRLFACLAGIPKKVTIICDESVGFDEVYVIDLL